MQQLVNASYKVGLQTKPIELRPVPYWFLLCQIRGCMDRTDNFVLIRDVSSFASSTSE